MDAMRMLVALLGAGTSLVFVIFLTRLMSAGLPPSEAIPTPKELAAVTQRPPGVTVVPLASATPVSATGTPIRSSFTLYFASDRGGQGAIYRLEGDEPPTLIATDPHGVWDPALRPGQSGESLLAFTSYRANNGDIALVGTGGGRPTFLVTHPADDYSPAWSPDGRELAFVSEREGGQDLYLVAPDRPGAEARLTADTGLQRHRQPAWTPDGRALIFAGVDDNLVEGLYRLDLASGRVTALTLWPQQASMPAVSPAGEIAFVGWQGSSTRTLSVLSPSGDHLRTLLTVDHWISHPAWSVDGRWLVFTAWRDPAAGHDLYAIPASGGQPVRLTTSQGWDDAASPGRGAGTGGLPREPDSAESELPPPRSPLALGFNIGDPGHAFLIPNLGGEWVKGFVDWARTEPERGKYEWRDPDKAVRGAEHAGLRLFLRIYNAPVWSHPGTDAPSMPPDDPAAFARFAAEVARRYRGRVAAYELWNEPNLAFEWGNSPPDPSRYVEMLKAAYPAIKAVDPGVTVVAGALSSTAGGSSAAVSDLDYLTAMYAAGAAHGVTHDVIATHPYGFARPPSAAASGGLGLRHVEAQHAVMEAASDAASPIWITETGWPVKASAWDLGEHAQWAVDYTIQAEYYADLPDTVAREWPYVEALFPFNLDFSVVPWYRAGEQMRAYAILNPDGSPRPAYTALRLAMLRR